jgi:cardiolipin synthase
VRFHVFDPAAPFLGVRVNVFRRMHRKLVVVDGVRAFVGGLNYSADHLLDFGPEAKQDYAVEVEGPIVEDIHRFATEQLEPQGGARRWFRRWGQRAAPRAPQRAAGNAQALFVTRDNVEHHTDIERHYRIAIRAARREVLIANAYFFPGYRLLKEMRKAARRGVRVRLILQGEPDMAIVKTAANALYDHLLRAGVQIYEYCERPLHAKVALTDDEWATVGSSNLDPLSLSLNLEANVVIRDRAFNQQLRERLEHLIAHACEEVQASPTKLRLWEVVRFFFVYHFLRRYPSWAGWLPAHVPRLSSAPTGSAKAEAGTSAVEPMALSPTDAPRELAER